MNAKTGKRTTLAAVAGAIALLLLQQPAFAEGNCKEVKGKLVEVFSGGNSAPGTITQGGILNGRTLAVFNSAAFPTPAPTIVSFSVDMTITTDHGQLKVSSVRLYDFVTGRGNDLGQINPKTSTGRFAGATGVLFLALTKTIGTSPPFTYPSDLTGQICLATRDTEQDHD